ncbi:hypothetical protein [Aeromicrobium sp. UC242_57]|uniref:hypothetical protein n=1 Tax=Aeromicrobium sp. UC242_57 TaxID=3374624 RepID=UPI0037B2D8EB
MARPGGAAGPRLNGDDGARASVYFLVEVNRPTQRRSLQRMFPTWQVARSQRGHNDVYSDPAQHRLIGVQACRSALGRGSSGTSRSPATSTSRVGPNGLERRPIFPRRPGRAAARAAASREVQGRRLAELCHEHRVDVLAADLNNLAGPSWYAEGCARSRRLSRLARRRRGRARRSRPAPPHRPAGEPRWASSRRDLRGAPRRSRRRPGADRPARQLRSPRARVHRLDRQPLGHPTQNPRPPSNRSL